MFLVLQIPAFHVPGLQIPAFHVPGFLVPCSVSRFLVPCFTDSRPRILIKMGTDLACEMSYVYEEIT